MSMRLGWPVRRGFTTVPSVERPEPQTGGGAAGHGVDLRAGQATAERCWIAAAAVAAFVPGDSDHLAAGARVPMEEVQYLAGHAEPRTTTLYDWRK